MLNNEGEGLTNLVSRMRRHIRTLPTNKLQQIQNGAYRLKLSVVLANYMIFCVNYVEQQKIGDDVYTTHG